MRKAKHNEASQKVVMRRKKMKIKLLKKERMDASIQIRMQPTLSQKLKRVADRKQMPRQELIRQVLQQAMDEIQEDEENERKVS
jgi:predicted DNA binding CopG/RHH family protein